MTRSAPNDSSSDAYKRAIDDTHETLRRRSSHYRFLVIAVVFTTFSALVLSAATRSWRPLVAMTALFPICAAFFWSDARTVTAWRRRLLTTWADGELNLPAVVATLSRIPGLPSNTLDAMLGSLPRSDMDISDRLSPPARRLIAESIDVAHSRSGARLLIAAAVSAIIVGTILISLTTRSRLPIIGLALIPVAITLTALEVQRRSRHLATTIRETRLDDEQGDVLARVVQSLHRRP